MDNNNFSYTFTGASGVEWTILMERGDLFINNISYECHDDDPTYDFAIAMQRVINEKP